LRDAGAIVTDCLSITSYEFAEANDAFLKEKVKLHTLTSFSHIFKEAIKMKKITQEEMLNAKEWIADPHGWGKKHGYE
jgi:orotate phosphoribosyltransferase